MTPEDYRIKMARELAFELVFERGMEFNAAFMYLYNNYDVEDLPVGPVWEYVRKKLLGGKA